MRSELGKRVAVALIGIPVVVLAVYFGGLFLALLLGVVAALGAQEFYRLALQSGVRAFAVPGIAASAGFILIAAIQRTPHAAAPYLWTLMVAMFLAVSASSIWARGVEGQPLFAVAATMLGPLLCGGALAYVIFLREMSTHFLPATGTPGFLGCVFVFFPLLVTWLNDTAAYFGGRALGKNKLIPRVSPGKTVEGAVAGLIVSIITGALYGAVVFGRMEQLPIGVLHGAAGGLLISIAAQVGDLAESLFKREAGVKDSGALLPGHGGVLDRLDALYFTVPIAYWYLAAVLKLGAEAWR